MARLLDLGPDLRTLRVAPGISKRNAALLVVEEGLKEMILTDLR